MQHADPTDAAPTSPEILSPASEAYRTDAYKLALLQRTPKAVFTILFVLANVAVYLVMVAKNVDWWSPAPLAMIEWGANYGPRTLNGELWRLLTCMFLHFGILHVGMNMLALWNLGGFVERMFGNVGFFLLYILSGLAGSLASVIYHPTVISAGASGAIFGVAGGLLGGTWKLRHSMPRPFVRSAWGLAINVIVLLAVFAVVNHFQNMIDNAAHVAGCITGSIIGLILAEPVPHPGRSRKNLRNAIVAIVGSLLLWLAITTLAGPPADVAGLETKFQRVERQTLRILDSARERRQAGAITPQEFATIVETEILPGWKELHQDFKNAENVPQANQEIMAQLLKIIELREDGWELEAEAIREDDPQKKQKSQELLQQATEIIQRLNQGAKKS